MHTFLAASSTADKAGCIYASGKQAVTNNMAVKFRAVLACLLACLLGLLPWLRVNVRALCGVPFTCLLLAPATNAKQVAATVINGVWLSCTSVF